jgi:glycosyltransferase involved in cell wall biosynthesis
VRVLHVAEVTHGGVITLIETFSRHQVEAGHDVHVLLRPEVGPVLGTRHEWTPLRRNPRLLLRAERRLHALAESLRPDVIHLHSFVPGVLGRSRAHPGTSAVVYQPHSFAFSAVPVGSAWLVALLERRAARKTDVMLTNCGDERDEGLRHGIDLPTIVAGLPVDTDRFAPSDRSPDFWRHSLALSANRVVVCVGRLSRQKGQRQLAQAWEAHPPPGTLLVLVGPGDAQEIARVAPRTYGDSLAVVGSQADVRPWLWAASIAVQPSLYEGQSVAMAEALATGVPVVITDVNGAKEAVAPPDGPSAGAVVPVGDLEAVMRELRRRLDAPTLRDAEAATARRRALELFAERIVMARVEHAYSVATSVAWGRDAGRAAAGEEIG